MSVLSRIDDIPIKAKVVCLSALSCATIVGLSAAATEEQSASSEEIASSANALANLADDLQCEVGKFKL